MIPHLHPFAVLALALALTIVILAVRDAWVNRDAYRGRRR